VKRQRKKHVFLNYFTVNQMMTLYADAKAGNRNSVLRALRYIAPEVNQSAVTQLLNGITNPPGNSGKSGLASLQKTHSHLTESLVAEGAWSEGITYVTNLGRSLQEVVGSLRPRFRYLQSVEGSEELERDDNLLVQGRDNVITGAPNSVSASSPEGLLGVLLTLYAMEGRVPEASLSVTVIITVIITVIVTVNVTIIKAVTITITVTVTVTITLIVTGNPDPRRARSSFVRKRLMRRKWSSYF